MVHKTAQSGFTAGVAAYEQGRPAYPSAALAHWVRVFALDAESHVVDVGAGTGKMSALLAQTGARVTAVEPVVAMRAHLEANCKGVAIGDGSAEATGLLAGSADLIVVAQAFHWFDAPRACAEFARVLRPRGGLTLIWNSRDARELWVAELSRIVRWNAGAIPTYDVGDEPWVQRVTAGGEFTHLGNREFGFNHEIDAAGLRARVLSISYIAALSPAEQAPILAAVDALSSGLPERFVLPYRTFVYDFRRR